MRQVGVEGELRPWLILVLLSLLSHLIAAFNPSSRPDHLYKKNWRPQLPPGLVLVPDIWERRTPSHIRFSSPELFSLTEPSILPWLLALAAIPVVDPSIGQGLRNTLQAAQPSWWPWPLTKLRGWLAEDAPVLVQQSSIPNAGRGVFATAPMPEGYVLGAYPGRVRLESQYYAKMDRYPAMSGYCWTCLLPSSKNPVCARMLDPTDEKGVLSEPLYWLDALPISSLSVNTTLALINEPRSRMKSDTNLKIVIKELDVLFIASRDIAAGEELFIDYGVIYDRSDYGPES